MLDAGAEDEDYNFDYEDDDEEAGGEADVENEYYVAKGMGVFRYFSAHPIVTYFS